MLMMKMNLVLFSVFFGLFAVFVSATGPPAAESQPSMLLKMLGLDKAPAVPTLAPLKLEMPTPDPKHAEIDKKILENGKILAEKNQELDKAKFDLLKETIDKNNELLKEKFAVKVDDKKEDKLEEKEEKLEKKLEKVEELKKEEPLITPGSLTTAEYYYTTPPAPYYPAEGPVYAPADVASYAGEYEPVEKVALKPGYQVPPYAASGAQHHIFMRPHYRPLAHVVRPGVVYHPAKYRRRCAGGCKHC